MISKVVAAVVVIVLQAEQSKLYEHTASNLKFTLAGPSKLVKKKGDWTITFPLEKGQATLQVFAISYTAAPDVWEGTQTYFAQQQKWNVLSMAKEEILGVPLLSAKTQETATLDRNVTWSGMVYAATDWKLSFRLTAAEVGFAEAESKWREALQSLATIDGKLPQPETPGRATEASAGKKKAPEVPDLTRTPIGSAPGSNTSVVIGDSSVACVAAGKNVELRAPKEFTLATKDGAVTVSHPELGSFVVVVASSLDSSSMVAAISAAAAMGLEEFTLVYRRNETLPKENSAGARTIRIDRDGDSANGPLFVVIAGGEKANFYWRMEWKSTGKPNSKQLEAVAAFIAGASVEPAK